MEKLLILIGLFGVVFVYGQVEVQPFIKYQHQVSSGKVTLLDSRRVKIEGFRYDGGANNAFFWVGQGSRPNRNGIQIPDEKGSYNVLRGYNKEDIILTLPSDMTFNDIDYLAVWCKRFVTNFGHIEIPRNLKLSKY